MGSGHPRQGAQCLPPHHPKTDREKAEALSLCYQWIDENAKQNKAVPILVGPYDHPSWARWRSAARILNLPRQNCPIGFLEQEVEKNTNFCLRMAAALPRVQIDKLAAEQQAQGIYKVTALVRNAGYLPTFVCNEAKTLGWTIR